MHYGHHSYLAAWDALTPWCFVVEVGHLVVEQSPLGDRLWRPNLRV